MSVFRRILKLYKRQVDKRPLLTQIITAGTMSTVCDVVTQRFIEKNKTHSFRRTAIMGSCGLFYFGPLNGAWLSVLKWSKLPAAACVTLDQGLFCVALISGFLGIQSVLTGKSVSASCERVKTDLFSVLKVNWMIWIPAQTINFYAVPFQFRMLFIQIVALFWNCYLSNKANEKTETEM